jgi:RNA polymerase sigma factor (sigma-70 family)
VEAVLGGERDAYATLVHRYERAVRGVAAHIVKDLHTAEDVAQNAFVKAYENLGRLRRGAAFGPWLLQIARREAVDALRTRARQVSIEEAPPLSAAARDGRLDERAAILLDAVMRLPAHERGVIVLRHFDGHSVGAIAAMTGRTVGTVTKQLSRAHARLRDSLGRKIR